MEICILLPGFLRAGARVLGRGRQGGGMSVAGRWEETDRGREARNRETGGKHGSAGEPERERGSSPVGSGVVELPAGRPGFVPGDRWSDLLHC